VENNFFVRDFNWSFSKLNCFDTCKYAFYLQYIEENKGIDNSFGQFGTHCHKILEKYANNELEIFELLPEYEMTYWETVTEKFPPNKYKDLGESYFNQGLEYFENFEGFDEYEILGVEEEVKFKIGEFNFTGFIDLVLRKDGIIINDHKSKSKLSKKEKEKYLKQLYLYSIPIKEKYGEYPKELWFNMIRFNEIIKEQFQMNKLEETKEWALNSINSILNEKDWKPTNSDYFCRFICGVRELCDKREY
jgi:hypothetical protein